MLQACLRRKKEREKVLWLRVNTSYNESRYDTSYNVANKRLQFIISFNQLSIDMLPAYIYLELYPVESLKPTWSRILFLICLNMFLLTSVIK